MKIDGECLIDLIEYCRLSSAHFFFKTLNLNSFFLQSLGSDKNSEGKFHSN